MSSSFPFKHYIMDRLFQLVFQNKYLYNKIFGFITTHNRSLYFRDEIRYRAKKYNDIYKLDWILRNQSISVLVEKLQKPYQISVTTQDLTRIAFYISNFDHFKCVYKFIQLNYPLHLNTILEKNSIMDAVKIGNADIVQFLLERTTVDSEVLSSFFIESIDKNRYKLFILLYSLYQKSSSFDWDKFIPLIFQQSQQDFLDFIWQHHYLVKNNNNALGGEEINTHKSRYVQMLEYYKIENIQLLRFLLHNPAYLHDGEVNYLTDILLNQHDPKIFRDFMLVSVIQDNFPLFSKIWELSSSRSAIINFSIVGSIYNVVSRSPRCTKYLDLILPKVPGYTKIYLDCLDHPSFSSAILPNMMDTDNNPPTLIFPNVLKLNPEPLKFLMSTGFYDAQIKQLLTGNPNPKNNSHQCVIVFLEHYNLPLNCQLLHRTKLEKIDLASFLVLYNRFPQSELEKFKKEFHYYISIFIKTANIDIVKFLYSHWDYIFVNNKNLIHISYVSGDLEMIKLIRSIYGNYEIQQQHFNSAMDNNCSRDIIHYLFSESLVENIVLSPFIAIKNDNIQVIEYIYSLPTKNQKPFRREKLIHLITNHPNLTIKLFFKNYFNKRY
ncbi:hypothetical protein DLAC_04306 [Tieghemostelium lacteum]|uniref:Ankyrin repeat-containing protein n=1 Tax=Tieghemostelium lacteum TaxID=361077 RepID=A0A151ZJ78_TIELA|nr:hypothetical protein DLAC_04306 [Tieghemostelium lacteum]|eukprot:KYQ94033.1 hypothetical protein DLAC_04306 [Tieghemostelium lacteum]